MYYILYNYAVAIVNIFPGKKSETNVDKEEFDLPTIKGF